MVRAVLLNADLAHADLTAAVLYDADLTGADLTAVDFTNVNLFLADVSGADFTGVTWSNSICPDGTNSDTNGSSSCQGHLG